MTIERFDKDFLPILLEQETARLFGTGCPNDGLNVICEAVGALPEDTHDFGAITAGNWTSPATWTGLEMNKLELAQLRCQVITECKMQIANPGSVKQWQLKNRQFYLPQFPVFETDTKQDYIWASSEHFVFEENTAQYSFYNTRARTNSFVKFHGWRFKLVDIGQVDPKIEMKTIWISEWPSISSTGRRVTNQGGFNPANPGGMSTRQRNR